MPIQHNTRQRTTLYVEWIYDYNGNNKGAYMINNGEMIGEFSCSTPLFEMTGISIVGRGDKKQLFSGVISTFESYASKDVK